MNERRANPRGYSQPAHNSLVDLAVLIVGMAVAMAIAASFGALAGRIIYRVFFGGV